MKSLDFFRRAGKLEIWSVTFGVIYTVVVAILTHYGVFHRGNPLILGGAYFTFMPAMVGICVDKWGSQAAKEALDAGAQQALPTILAIKTTLKIKEIHARTFPRTILDRGSAGKDITPIVPSSVPMREAGRQGGASVARRQASGSKSGDDDGGDGEPPHQCYTYASAAKILDCSAKALYNKVSAGLIPPPKKTAVGPRFTLAQLQALIDPPLLTPQKAAPKRRGRPRIAAVRGKGGAA